MRTNNPIILSRLLAIFIFGTLVLRGQDPVSIPISGEFGTMLIFSSPIVTSSMGDNAYFEAITTTHVQPGIQDSIIELQYRKGKGIGHERTNYSVITENGDVYYFELEQQPEPEKLVWHIPREMAVTNVGIDDATLSPSSSTAHMDTHGKRGTTQGNISKKGTRIPSGRLYEMDRLEFIRKKCYYQYDDPPTLPRYFAKNGSSSLWLKGVYFFKEELYIQVMIENNGSSEQEIKSLVYGIKNQQIGKTKDRRSDSIVEPKYTYRSPGRIPPKGTYHFVIVFDRFTIEREHEFLIEALIWDTYTDKHVEVVLSIDPKIINNPKKR